MESGVNLHLLRLVLAKLLLVLGLLQGAPALANPGGAGCDTTTDKDCLDPGFLTMLTEQQQASQGWSAPFRAQCEKLLPPGAIQVRQSSAFEIVQNEDIPTLSAKARPYTNKAGVTLGLTKATAGFTGNFQYKYARLGNQRICARVNLDVLIELKNYTVSIAREHPKGTCEYGVILEHELEHVHLNQRNLSGVTQRLQSQLQTLYGGILFFDQEKIFYPQEALKQALVNAKRDWEQRATAHQAIDDNLAWDIALARCRGRARP